MRDAALVQALDLVFVADEEAAGREAFLGSVLEGGVTAIWLRAPDATGRTLDRLARRLGALVHEHRAALIVGDRFDVALTAGAEGVQLGRRAPPLERVRPHFAGWIGVSCHGAQDLAHAESQRADYAVLSPVGAVPDKGAPLGVEGFGALRRPCRLPVVALGGLDASNAPALRAAGADGIAVRRSLLEARDPSAAARALRRRMTSS